MKHYTSLLEYMTDEPGLRPWLTELPGQLTQILSGTTHGNLSHWQASVAALPAITASYVDLNANHLHIGSPDDCTDTQRAAAEQTLRLLHPWRKGPYNIHGIHIDTEWRSDWKWQRLAKHIAPLHNRLVLDVGCGNGYHCWRMLGAGARRVIGIDPTLLSVMQFHAIKHFAGDYPADVLPIGIDDVPRELEAFDTVFSMGVLYHRRSPMDHLLELKGCLQAGGQLVLETLVIDGCLGQILVPNGRYAKMRNVWSIPSCATLENWLQRCGFQQVRLVDVTRTSFEEQRSTDWMRFHSLADFLDPDNPSLTCEGLPAPIRAIFLAEKP